MKVSEEVIIAVTVKIIILWDVTPYGIQRSNISEERIIFRVGQQAS